MMETDQTKNKKEYIPPTIEVIELEMEQGIAAGSPVQPGGGSGVTEEEWIDGGEETKDPNTPEWWK